MTHILIFGDSITYGAWDKEGGWAERLKRFSHQKTLSEGKNNLLVYNLGVSGDTSEDILERFEFETKRRLDKEEENIVICSIGINDSQILNAENNPKISLKKHKENIQKLIILSQKFFKKAIFIGLTPVDELKVNPIPWKLTHSYKNELIKKFDNASKEICDKNEISFIEIFEKIIKEDYKNLLEDGLHPNSEGHKKIFEILKDSLIKNKII